MIEYAVQKKSKFGTRRASRPSPPHLAERDIEFRKKCHARAWASNVASNLIFSVIRESFIDKERDNVPFASQDDCSLTCFCLKYGSRRKQRRGTRSVVVERSSLFRILIDFVKSPCFRVSHRRSESLTICLVRLREDRPVSIVEMKVLISRHGRSFRKHLRVFVGLRRSLDKTSRRDLVLPLSTRLERSFDAPSGSRWTLEK